MLSALLLVIGIAMVVSALARGGGALAFGVVLGDAVALLGAGRLWLRSRARRRGAVSRSGRGGVAGSAQMSGRAREGLKRGSERARVLAARTLGEPALFAITLSAVASAIFFSLGVVANGALGLTPVVFLLAGVFFAVTMATYVEGSSLHIERGGASTFARYAFDEFWSFVAGWAILLDYLIVMAIGAVVVSEYLAAFWSELDEGALPLVDRGRRARCSWRSQNVRGLTGGPARRRPAAVAVQHRGARGRLGDRVHRVLGPGRDHSTRSTSAWRRAGRT